ncbi:hypothetical protein AB9P05_05045 [Roseivirga sp. BDSF3-8]|uniref:hypothetical protein n=1 Tax=Roseivirga sp. BDSF3-8 TaxID=3241598 RepID=UPI00353272A9
MKTFNKLCLSAFTLLAILLISASSQAQTSLELDWSGGPYIDFKNNNVDYDARLRLVSDGELRLQGSSFHVWDSNLATRHGIHFTQGATGQHEWYFHTSPASHAKDHLFFGNRTSTTAGWSWVAAIKRSHFWSKKIAISGDWSTARVPAGYRLSVDGKIMAEEVHVQNSAYWPDFVFDEDYDLLSLDATESFIKENHHLPGIPSAAEVEAEGFDLAHMNKLLLQKIEELTLHAIDQERRLEQQQAQIEQLIQAKLK